MFKTKFYIYFHIWYSFLTKAQPFTLYCQFELFRRFYIPEMTFLAQYLLYHLNFNVYILYQFSPNSVVSVQNSSITHFFCYSFYSPINPLKFTNLLHNNLDIFGLTTTPFTIVSVPRFNSPGASRMENELDPARR